MCQWASALQTFPWERLCTNYINYFSNKDQSSASSSDRWTVGFRKRFILRLLLLTRPGHSDLGFLSAEWTSFTERAGRVHTPAVSLAGIIPESGNREPEPVHTEGSPTAWVSIPDYCTKGGQDRLPQHPASCGEHCCAHAGWGAGSSEQADPTGCFLLPPDDGRAGAAAGRASEPAERPWVWGIWRRGGGVSPSSGRLHCRR